MPESPQDDLQAAVTLIELKEAGLLAWGLVAGQWKRDELRELLDKHGFRPGLLDQMVDRALVVETPQGGYRSRAAETIRLLSLLRQSWADSRVENGTSLLADFRYLHRPRRRPRRTVHPAEASAALGLADRADAVFRALAPSTLSGFQERSSRVVLDALTGSASRGVMVTAGTGSGKTLAFYLPLLSWLAEQPGDGVRALGLYPRIELLKDQLKTILGWALRLGRQVPSAQPISVGAWFGPVPRHNGYVLNGWSKEWTRRRDGFECPYLDCLECGGPLFWPVADCTNRRERLVCTAPGCGSVIDGRHLRLTRDSACANPPTIMLTTTESINRQLSSPRVWPAFGIGRDSLRAVLLDEVHTYEGTTGAQNAYLLRRLRHAMGDGPLLFAGLSATLTEGPQFFARLVNLPETSVRLVEPYPEELEEVGAEYLLVLRHDPNSGTGTLSASIQTLMTLGRCQDVLTSNPFNPAPDSGGIMGKRTFAFTDKLDSTNRLYWDLLDAEGWRWPGRLKDGRGGPLTLAHLRSETQAVVAADRRTPAPDRDADGQWWWLPQLLGHEIDGDVGLSIGRTSSQDRGVAQGADVVVATATLEVGYDDELVGTVVQHKAPRDPAQFLQRKGRAGRDIKTRPWTVVVLSDWGRDRDAWESYESIFEPTLPARPLPTDNLYVIRIQAVYALFDWLGKQLNFPRHVSPWRDLLGPVRAGDFNADATRQRQHAAEQLLMKVLRRGPEQAALARHLRHALKIPPGTAGDDLMNKLLWEAPRPLILAVIPTIRRRLRDQWAGEAPTRNSDGTVDSTPLREFIPGNLFDELLVPDVEMIVPVDSSHEAVDPLPAMRALREFCPGNVSRHFGIKAGGKRHWVPLPSGDPRDSRFDVTPWEPLALETVVGTTGSLRVMCARRIRLAQVPEEVRDASTVSPEWRFHHLPLGSGLDFRLHGAAAEVLSSLVGHLHLNGDGVRVSRYACHASGTVFLPGPQWVRYEYGTHSNGEWERTAVGTEVYCDALVGRVRHPPNWGAISPQERVDWLEWSLATSADLPIEMSTFQRSLLADALVVAQALGGGTVHTLEAEDFRLALTDALRRMAILDPEEKERGGEAKGRKAELLAFIADGSVITELTRILTIACASTRTEPWETWLRRRFTLSVGHVLLLALGRRALGVDSDSLSVDLPPDSDDVFVISEESPGGTGHVEQFARSLVDSPESLGEAMDDAMRPGDFAEVDRQMRAVLTSGDPSLRSALDRLRSAWARGHEEVAKALETLTGDAKEAGLALLPQTVASLAARMLGPGAHTGLLDAVADWTAQRDTLENMIGFALSARRTGAVLGSDASNDDVLRLDSPSVEQRSLRIASILWPRGGDTSSSGSPLSEPELRASAWMVARAIGGRPRALEVAETAAETVVSLKSQLASTGMASVESPVNEARRLRAAILTALVDPTEVGPLLCHPTVSAVRSDGERVTARLLLREAL